MCVCHILTLVILFVVITTSISIVIVALSPSLPSCRRTKLNCGNKENGGERERERETILFIHSFLALSLSFSRSRTLNEQNKREGETYRVSERETKEEKKMSIKQQTYAIEVGEKRTTEDCCYC